MIFIDYKDPRPLCEQVVDRITELAARGVLEPGSQLPTVRQLALDLSINPNTIQKAYSMLERNGIIVSVKGKGSFVSEDREKIRRDCIASINKSLCDLIRQAALIGYPATDFIEKTQQYFADGKGESDD